VGANPLWWAAIWSNFKAMVDSIFYVDLRQAINRQSDYLALYGNPTQDVGEIFGAMLQAASADYGLATLASSVDAYSPTPGLPLSFERVASDALRQRYTFGALGWGWSHNLEYKLDRPEESTIVIRGPRGSERRFTQQSNGTWQGSAGDTGQLEELPDFIYDLREKDGQIWHFGSAGRLVDVEDTNGNHISLVYGVGGLTHITHSNGQLYA
jgi:hypothetical protein